MRRILTSFVIAVAIAAGLSFTASLNAISNSIVISQVYGGGGNAGSVYKNDFIELFNRGTSTVNLTGWSVQYASAAGSFSTSNLTPLSGSIPPGGYYLVQESAGAGGTTGLPAPDVSGGIAMAATAGKVALVSSTTALVTTGCPLGASVVDYIGYGTGTGGANCFEGTIAAPTLTNTTANLRAAAGCTDTDANSSDFATGAPAPRNSATAANACGNQTNPTAIGSASPGTVTAGNSTTLTVTVTPGANPTSTGIAVRADLSTIGGSSTQAFSGSGNVFTFAATVPVTTSPGPATLPVTVIDGQNRSATTSIALTVAAISTSPSGVGAAAPSGLQAGGSTLLTVRVTAGTSPASTGLTATANLTLIGGSAAQPFYDDGSNGDVTANDKTFSFAATVPAGTTQGAKSLPVTIADAQSRTGSASIALTVQPPPPPTTVKISQVYGGGGNSGSTYTNDFVEIYNQALTPIDVSFWSVQYNSATQGGVWQTTNLCGSGQTCILQPGHYYLVQESQGTGGTTALPAPDATGVITMGAGSGKIALVADTVALSGNCPTGGSLVDLIGYGTADCRENAATATLSNTTAAVRKSNGCIDTDNNSTDFAIVGPIPRNGASPANVCGGDPTLPSGVGIASPGSVEPASTSLLTVRVTPATVPPSTGVNVIGDLTSIAGQAAQPFYDDGTHGDETIGDGIYSFLATVGRFVTTGVKNIVSTLTDAQGRSAAPPVTLTVSSPTCGVERWSVKTGTDPDAAIVALNSPVTTTIAALGAIPAPTDPPGPPLNARVGPTETTVYVLNATMTLYKKEADVDYHIVLDDGHGHLMIAEIPSPACVGAGSPFAAGISMARAKFDAYFAAAPANPFFQSVSVPVQVKGVGFFDFIHGQTGVAPNGIELHPVVDISFPVASTTVLLSAPNPSVYGQPIALTATVGNGGASVPTGDLIFLEDNNQIGSAVLDANGQAVFNINNEAAGAHTLSAAYQGDGAAAPGVSAPVVQTVNKADQTISVTAIGGKTYGDGDVNVDSQTSSGLPATLTIASGPATLAGHTLHITGAGTVVVNASQDGDANYNAAAAVTTSFVVAKAAQAITFAAPADKTYGDAPFTVTATGGASGNPVTFAASGACTASGVNGSSIALTGSGSCTVTASQAEHANYSAAPDVARSLTVNRATAIITVGGYTGPYDRQAHGASKSATGISGEDLGALLDLGATFTDVPGGTAHWVFTGSANYAAASGDAAIAITPVSLIASAADASRGYGAGNPPLTGVIAGVIAGDDITAAYDTTATPGSAIGGYPITPSLIDPAGRLGNYTVSTHTGTLTIAPVALLAAAASATRGYGLANPAFSGALTGMRSGDNITVTYASPATPSSAIGSYPIAPTLVDPDGRLGNYTVSATNGTLIVSPASLTVVAGSASRAYGAANPALSGTITGIVNNDNITASYSSAALPGSAVGPYAITPTVHDPDGRLVNYAVSIAGGTLTVTPAALTITIADALREYGAANPPFTGALGGVTAGDNITASYGSSAVPTSPLGSYAIVATLADPNGRLGNYAIAAHNGVLTVVDTTPPQLSLPAPMTRQAQSPAGIAVTYTVSAADSVDGAVAVSCAPSSGAVFPVGTTSVACSAHDGRGNTANGAFGVTVLGDTTPPVITAVTPSIAMLWPPNKKMVPVSIDVRATDNLGQAPACRVVSISSSEGDSRDWQITGALTVSLRADRDDAGRGRGYTITVRCTDAFGNAASGTARVLVLHDREDDDKDQDNDRDKDKEKDKDKKKG